MSGCWLWTGATSSKGTPVLLAGSRLVPSDRRAISARRFAYEFLIDKLPDCELWSTCIQECCNPAHATLRTGTPEERRAAKKARRQGYYKARSLAKKYGLSIEAYRAMHNAQDNRCAVCGSELTSSISAVDHCHISGRVREILCISCNTGLGHFRDRPALLRAAADYLVKHGTPEDS